MLDIGWSEMMVVGAVALVVIGPKDLPAALRQAGKWMGAVRRMASDFQGHVNEAIREAELDELRKEVNNLKSGVSGLTDPVRGATNDIKALVEKPALLPSPEAPAATTSVQAETGVVTPAASEPAAPASAPKAKASKPKAAQPRASKPAAAKDKAPASTSTARAPRKPASRTKT